MDFFGMGMGEILLILVIALLVWGPGKIPEIAHMLGKTMNNLKKMSFDLTTQIKKELEEENKESRAPLKTAGGDKAVKPSDTKETGNTEKNGQQTGKNQ